MHHTILLNHKGFFASLYIYCVSVEKIFLTGFIQSPHHVIQLHSIDQFMGLKNNLTGGCNNTLIFCFYFFLNKVDVMQTVFFSNLVVQIQNTATIPCYVFQI